VFSLSALGLFRWPGIGWWLSIVLDGLIAISLIPMLRADFSSDPGELAFHGPIFLLCVGAIGVLLLARDRFLKVNP
jgi:hypothetical protein